MYYSTPLLKEQESLPIHASGWSPKSQVDYSGVKQPLLKNSFKTKILSLQANLKEQEQQNGKQKSTLSFRRQNEGPIKLNFLSLVNKSIVQNKLEPNCFQTPLVKSDNLSEERTQARFKTDAKLMRELNFEAGSNGFLSHREQSQVNQPSPKPTGQQEHNADMKPKKITIALSSRKKSPNSGGVTDREQYKSAFLSKTARENCLVSPEDIKVD